MAWDFSTEPEFQEKLDWAREFVTQRVEPLDLLYPHRQFHPLDDELRPIVQPNRRHMVIIANFSGADQGDPNRIGRRFFFRHIRKTNSGPQRLGLRINPARVSIFRLFHK